MPVTYKGMLLDCGYRVDILVDGRLVIELKAVEKIMPIHEAQVLTYLRMGGWQIGLIVNFHVELLKNGIKRIVHKLKE